MRIIDGSEPASGSVWGETGAFRTGQDRIEVAFTLLWIQAEQDRADHGAEQAMVAYPGSDGAAPDLLPEYGQRQQWQPLSAELLGDVHQPEARRFRGIAQGGCLVRRKHAIRAERVFERDQFAFHEAADGVAKLQQLLGKRIIRSQIKHGKPGRQE
jgi:hypothetical protein